MGIALPQFLLSFDGASGGVLLLGIVGVCILLPLMIAVISVKVIQISWELCITPNFVHILLFNESSKAVPLSARKAAGGNSGGIAPFLQLPYFNETTVKRIGRKKVRTFQELREMSTEDRSELLTQAAGFSAVEARDVELVLKMIPSITVDITCETEGEEGIQEGDVVSMYAWVTLERGNGLIGALPHALTILSTRRRNFGCSLLTQSPTKCGCRRK